MAIGTYSELQTACANWLNRSDLTARIPEFIALAEAYFQKELRVNEMKSRVDFTIDSEFEDVPSDFLEISQFHLDTNPKTVLTQMSEGALVTAYPNAASGKPVAVAVVGSSFRFGPTPDSTYTGKLTYFQKIPALSDSNTTNWLLTSHPDIYLYTTLIQSAPYLHDDARIGTWSTLALEGLERLKRTDKRVLFNSLPTRVTLQGVTVV